MYTSIKVAQFCCCIASSGLITLFNVQNLLVTKLDRVVIVSARVTAAAITFGGSDWIRLSM